MPGIGIGLGLSLGGGSGAASLTASASTFLSSVSSGAVIAALNAPFANPTYSLVGTVPAPLALSAGNIVATSTAATAGQSYSVKVRAENAGNTEAIEKTLSFLAQAGAATAPSISFAQPSVTVVEGTGGNTTVSNTITAVRNGTPVALVVNLTYGGTATAGTDYQTPPASVTIPAGSDSVSFDIIVIGDSAVEAAETLTIQASATVQGFPTASATKTITIADDDATPTYFDATQQRMAIGTVAPVIDLDYESSNFWVGAVRYGSVDAAVAAGVCTKAANSPLGDRWSFGSAIGTFTARFIGASGSTVPTSTSGDLYLYSLDNGLDGTNDEMAGCLWKYNSDTATPIVAYNVNGSSFSTGSPSNTTHISANQDMSCALSLASGSGNGRLAVRTNTVVSSNPATRNVTLTNLVVGGRQDGRSFGGTVRRLTIWSKQTTATELTGYTKAALTQTSIPSWQTGFLVEQAVTLNNKVYTGGYLYQDHFAFALDSSGGATNGAIVEYGQLSRAIAQYDDHCKPAIIENGAGLIWQYGGHNASTLLRYRRSTTKSLSGLQTEQTADATGSGPNKTAYAEMYRHAATGTIYSLFRQSEDGVNYTWAFTKSTDEGATWSTARRLLQNDAQFYVHGTWLDADRLIFTAGENPRTNPQNTVCRMFVWNVSTGDIEGASGVKGNSYSNAATTGVELSTLTVFKDGVGTGTFGGPAKFGLTILCDGYRRYSGSGSIYDIANWPGFSGAQVAALAPGGTPGGLDQTWTGGTCVSNLASLSKPRMFRAVHEGAFWKLLQLDAVDEAGTDWARTKTLRQVTDENYNMLFRPFSPINCTAGIEVMWTEGLYKDYQGQGNLDLRLCWKRDA